MKNVRTTIIPDMTGTRVLFIEAVDSIMARYPVIAWKVDVEVRPDGGDDLVLVTPLIGDIWSASPEETDCPQLMEYTVNGTPYMWISADATFFKYEPAAEHALRDHAALHEARRRYEERKQMRETNQ